MAVTVSASSFYYLHPDQGLAAGPPAVLSDSKVEVRLASGLRLVIEGPSVGSHGTVTPRSPVTALSWVDATNKVLGSISFDTGLKLGVVLQALASGAGVPAILSGNTQVEGTSGADVLDGFHGNDVVSGGAGNDMIGGGSGNDLLIPGAGNDYVHGGVDLDSAVISGRFADYVMTVKNGIVRLESKLTGEVDTLVGVEIVQFDDGPQAVFPAFTPTTSGDDIYYLTPSSTTLIREAANGGFDHINLLMKPGADGTIGAFTLPQNVESIAVSGSGDESPQQQARLIGNSLDNSMFGSPEIDTLEGNAGNDQLHGAGGADKLLGGAGNDRIYGASGDDAITGDAGDDALFAGSGADVVRGGSGNDEIHGDDLNAHNRFYSEMTPPAAGGDSPTDMNVLFLCIDDLATVLSAYADSPIHAIAPNLDALLAGSTVFSNAFVTAPACNASRASTLLGVDPNTSGVNSNLATLEGAREQFQSLPAFLKSQGYFTAQAGKVFHNANTQGDPDAWSATAQFQAWMDWLPPSWNSEQHGFPIGGGAVPDTAFADGRSVGSFLDFLEQDHASPFFYGLGLFKPHAPYYIPQKYYDLYPLDSLTIPPGAAEDLNDIGWIGKALAARVSPGVVDPLNRLGLINGNTPESTLKTYLQAYLAAVSYADALVGQALEGLRESAYADNTMIVFWSDNGIHLGEKLAWNKFTLWDSSLKVPLAIKMPGQTEGQVVDQAVSLMDLYPTLVDLLGLDAPAHLQGRSLSPLLSDPDLAWDKPVVSEWNGNFSVRTNDYRYIHYWDGSEELYLVKIDPGEKLNVAGNPAFAGIIADLQTYLPAGNDLLYGEAGNDVIHGWGGNDTIEGGEDDDLLFGETGNDILRGGSGNDVLYGGAGSDNLTGGGGQDVSFGGVGNDLYVVHDVRARVIERTGEGNDTVLTFVDFTLPGEVENLTLGGGVIQGTGNNQANRLLGNAEANLLFGLAGNDTLDGGGGADRMFGGAGNDTYMVDNAGDQVFETISAEDGRDAGGTDTVVSSISFNLALNNGTLFVENLLLTGTANLNAAGNALNNRIDGNAGANTIDGGAGADLMAGGGGNDVYIVDNAGDYLWEIVTFDPGDIRDAGGVDSVFSSVSYSLNYRGANYVEHLILTGSANLNATGNALDNYLAGNSGANRLDGGAGADTMVGGAGDDVYILDNANDTVAEAAGGGQDKIFSSISVDMAAYPSIGFVEDLELVGTANLTGRGNALANTIIGSGGDDTLFGAAGDDWLVDNAGNDSLDGGIGADVMLGGAGNDIYTVDQAADQVFETVGTAANDTRDAGGVDTIVAGFSYDLGARNGTRFVENLMLSGTVDLNATGNGLNNRLGGNAGANRLEGGVGADVMLGGAGNDTYIVDNGSDQVIETLTDAPNDSRDAGGVDTVISTVNYSLVGNGARYVERLTLTGSANLNATGNALDNVITGTAGANRLDGGAGADTMVGGAGDDVYIFDNANDRAVETSDGGRDKIIGSVSLDLAASSDFVEDLELAGSGNFSARGNALANTITGNGGANVLDGWSGNDLLFGNGGNDALRGGAGRDVLTGGAGADRFVFDDGEFGGNTNALADVITDFSRAEGDRIDLSLVDGRANTAADDPLYFLGTSPFTSGGFFQRGFVRFTVVDGNTYIQGDVNGDRAADFVIRLDGVHNLTASDFIL